MPQVTLVCLSDCFCSWPSLEHAEDCPLLHGDSRRLNFGGQPRLWMPANPTGPCCSCYWVPSWMDIKANFSVHHQSQEVAAGAVSTSKGREDGHISAANLYGINHGEEPIFSSHGCLRMQHKPIPEHRFTGTHCTPGLNCRSASSFYPCAKPQ